MGWASGFVLYVVFWTISLFTVLPWGVRATGANDIGTDPGAPVNPRLRLKFLITSLIAAVLWGIAYAVIKSDLIPLRGF